MLIATPYRDFDVRDRIPPKVIAEVRKTYLSSTVNGMQLRLSANLLVKYPTERLWYSRRVQVKSGQLLVSSAQKTDLPLRIPLRNLSLQAGSTIHSLSICRGQNIVLTLQMADETSFDRWVKTLAIELIRQTPLDAIKYLDILTLAKCWSRIERKCAKDLNDNNVILQRDSENNQRVDEETRLVPGCCEKFPLKTGNVAKAISKNNSSEVRPNDPEEVVESLLKKCQNVETYVPVKEKLFLFESLCKMGRKVRSSEDVSLKPQKSTTKRAKSCHDLSSLNTQIAVREICKYFEKKGTGDELKHA
ncbi:uncharacterized protein LOC109544640 [Dendroctonus ponderosae]|uniref:uncharacterized protein LOC109544640 n=1 Tax=Dendroctonus ponderosae TaxID=77166 RepID=UPI00203540B5|nr:uncharacterized protein LOC109544640 [Dendroctonus ponderosae]